MKRLILLFFILSLLDPIDGAACLPSGKQTDSVNDGPYVFNVRNKLRVMSIQNGKTIEEQITPENFPEIKSRFNLPGTIEDLSENFSKKPNFQQSFQGVDSIAVISDIHGQYGTYIRLLQSTGIIGKDLKWKFGKGHLVVLGDVFDRGDKVTEVLWHIFALEKQAAESGGMVHLLLGNHEIMTLSGGLFYMNEKYKTVEKISGTSYSDLYSGNSVLGNWLRSKPVAITINDIIFVHGGISSELVKRHLSFKDINEIFSKKITGRVIKEPDRLKNQMLQVQNDNATSRVNSFGDSLLTAGYKGSAGSEGLAEEREYEEIMFLVNDNGPIWYRGYFTDPGFTEKEIDSILDYYGKKHVVVGHTTCEDIDKQFNNKIFGVDTGIGAGREGEMLIYKNGSFYSSLATGDRIKL